MVACSQFPLRCQHTSVKVVVIENAWIGTLKRLFLVGVVVYIW